MKAQEKMMIQMKIFQNFQKELKKMHQILYNGMKLKDF